MELFRKQTKDNMKKVRIGDRLLGEGEPCFVIAEAGVNHNGDVNLAKKLIDVAREAGADAVKFQTFKTEEVFSIEAKKVKYQKETTGTDETLFEMIKKLEFSERDFEDLYAYAQERKIAFLSSPFDGGSVDLLDRLGVPAFKIASGEITNFPLLRHITAKGRPIILSTGMSTLAEVEDALNVIQDEGMKDIILLHCVSNYPAKIENTNLKAMETLRQAFELPVGLSDHSLGITIPVAAVALGACVIEKHFTLEKNLPGPDHQASLEPDELKEMIRAIRGVEKALGDGIKRSVAEEEEIKKASRRSIVASVDIPEGAIITQEMLAIKRPGTGIEPSHLDTIIGKRAKKDIKSGEPINFTKMR